MARVTVFSIIVAMLFITTATTAVEVSGYAYLIGEPNHTNIQVIFAAVSPSAETDTTYSDYTGYFGAVIEPGVYDVLYSHDGYAVYRLPNQILLWDTVLNPVMLMPPLSGHLSGTLGPGDFQVTDSIVVDSGQTLTILPGTRLWFEPGCPFLVLGHLSAQGQVGDSILFTQRLSSGDTTWTGVMLIHAADSNRLDYCVIERGRAPAYGWGGGGIWCDYFELSVTHSTISSNEAYSGGGVSLTHGSAAIFEDCIMSENRAWSGSAIYAENASLILQHCQIVRNSTVTGGDHGGGLACWDSQITIEECVFEENANGSGSGIFSSRSDLTVVRSVFDRNGSPGYGNGGAITLNGGADPVFDHCVFSRNFAREGGAIYCGGDSLRLLNCTFFGNVANAGSALYFGDAFVEMVSLTVAFGDTNTGMYYWGNRGAVYFAARTSANIRYSCFFGNIEGPFAHSDYDSSGIPPALGLIALTNANGDSCDTYYNTFMDPQFVDTADGDYHLLAESPCIDAGDPELPNDPDGTVADIGAFYFDQLDVPDWNRTAVRGYQLAQNYPNPFNSLTQIVFDLPRNEFVELAVYDITGRRIATLLAGTMAAGQQVVSFDASALPSGIYFYRLEGGGFSHTKKMVLIK